MGPMASRAVARSELGTGAAAAESESDGPVERGRSHRRRLSQRGRGGCTEGALDGERGTPRRRQRTRQSLGAGDSQGYASSPTESRRLRRGHADSVHATMHRVRAETMDDHGSSGPETVSDRVRRRVAPVVVAGSETEGTVTPAVPSPPLIVDKPREERSYKEFFPDLNVHMPLVVQAAGAEALAAGGIATPVSSGSEAAAAAVVAAQLDFGPGGGKGVQSYAGTPQSSVVVLAPKRPVVGLPEARFRRVARERRPKYVRPDGHYIHNVELTEEDLAERVEYDLDQVDQQWLAGLNAERAERGAGEVSAKQLEAMVDHMEKEWFDLVKDTQRAISAMQQGRLAAEESMCAICGEDECDNANAIVFCDGCNMAVHQDCYGVPYIPEGQWLCRRCMLSPDKDVACVLCPQRGGAFKKTTSNKWAHVLCALWIPEVGIANTVYMEPIDGVDQIPRSRWRLYCHLCHRRAGACIQCSHRQCVIAFHATCARRAGLSMAVRADRRSGEPVFRAYCERHTPPGHTQPIDVTAPLRQAEVRRRPPPVDGSGGSERPAPAVVAGADAEVRALLEQAAGGDEGASLRLTMRAFNADVPVLNEYVVARVAARMAARLGGVHQRQQLAAVVARYWALKRRERHGAPLLKRLHLEPWTASATQHQAQEVAEDQCQGVVRRVRTDLERVRLLVESVRRREREKLRRARLQIEYIRRIVAPLTDVLLPLLDELIEQRDPRGVLARPVSEDDAPDYYQVIKEPMDFGTMRAKLLDGAYPDLPDFERDLELVVANCLRYNKPATYYYRLATRIKAHIARLLTDARRSIATLPIDPASGCLMVPLSPEIFSLTLDMPAPPSPLREASDASVAEEPNESEEPTPEASKEPEGPAEPMATPTRPQTRSRASSSTPRARRPAATRDQGRRLTLFEQLSLPPPDVRQMLRGRFALAHPEAETAPDSDIPDDINVLATRLRAGSQRPTPAAPDTPTGKRKRDAWTIPTAERLGEDPGAYPAGTAVWAKMESYPWFPAETCDPTAPSVPDTVRAMARLPDATALVQFFAAAPAAARQWRWVSPRQICRLGADPAVDADFFRARKAKSSNMVRSVRLAYAHACDAMGIAPLAS